MVGAFQIDKSKFEIQMAPTRFDADRVQTAYLLISVADPREALHSDALGYQNPIITRTVDTHTDAEAGNGPRRVISLQSDLGPLPRCDAEKARL